MQYKNINKFLLNYGRFYHGIAFKHNKYLHVYEETVVIP